MSAPVVDGFDGEGLARRVAELAVLVKGLRSDVDALQAKLDQLILKGVAK